MNRSMYRHLSRVGTTAALGVALVACVDSRPVRNGLRDESTYLEKTTFTQPNPRRPDQADDAWLMKVTVVAASSPNVVGDYAFPGFESDLKLVKLRFREDALQVVDGKQLQVESPANPNDDLGTSTARVMLEFPGTHVDVKLRESLDGERTNWLEENTEAPWQVRQQFKVDWERISLDPITQIAWFYGDFLHDCAKVVGTHLEPDSFAWDEAERTLNFVLEVTYQLNVINALGGCWDMTSLATGVGTTTIKYRFSFHQPGASTYQPEVIREKDPINKTFGAFQILSMYQDPETGLLGAQSLIQRWDPKRKEPAVYYFAPGFPPRFKPMFQEVERSTNAILERAGADLRVAFREHDDGGVVRQLGDVRYSFVVWHQDIETTRGLLGYGPSSADPRTGEVLSANVNLYNIGLDWYRFLIEDYLETYGAETRPDPSVPWERTACTPGTTVAPASQSNRLKTTLWEEMRRVMDLPPSTDTSTAVDDFVPQPVRPEAEYLADYTRLLTELRYANPAYNPYVYRTTGTVPLADLPALRRSERSFRGTLGDVLANRDPFKGAALGTRDGIQAQNDFRAKFRQWKSDRFQVEAHENLMLGLKSISTFDASDALGAISRAARRCKSTGFYESDAELRERIIEAVVEHVAIHELGHTLSLRHNFYGSVDKLHMDDGAVSASVMDYVQSAEEAGSPRGWGGYDEAALSWIFGNAAARQRAVAGGFLYCTDEHADQSPMCRRHDLGVTPAEIVVNAIERYDWLYAIRNRRAFRTFWDTSGYIGSVYNSMFAIQRFWHLAIFDWGGGGVPSTLKRLDQVEGRSVLTDQEYDERSRDFYNDLEMANRLTIAFYDAVINQPASFRNYQTEYDPFYGDVLRLGIIIDKLFTTFAFMDLQEIYEYNPNVSTYAAMCDVPFGTHNEAIARRVLDNMLGAGYDTFPWFKYYALNIFAAITNTNLVNTTQLKERIAIRRFETEAAFAETYGREALEAARALDNPAQLFSHEGEQYVYTYLADRGWHLVSGRSRNPVSFQFIKEYNEKLRAQGNDTEDNYGLKILLAYYEYYNNFSGF